MFVKATNSGGFFRTDETVSKHNSDRMTNEMSEKQSFLAKSEAFLNNFIHPGNLGDCSDQSRVKDNAGLMIYRLPRESPSQYGNERGNGRLYGNKLELAKAAAMWERNVSDSISFLQQPKVVQRDCFPCFGPGHCQHSPAENVIYLFVISKYIIKPCL